MTHRSTALKTALLVLFTAFATTACRRTTVTEKQESLWATMGTFAALTFPAGVTNDFTDAERACRNCYKSINDTLSVYSPDTELSRLNATPADTPVALSPLAADTIRAALDMANRTGGRFDPTITPLVNLWGFNGHTIPEHPPTPENIQAILDTVGYTHAQLTPNGSFTWLRNNMSIDLGGIAKGVGVDLCYDALKDLGVSAAVINLGGNVRFLGTHPEKRGWRAGIRDPFNHDLTLGQLEIPSGMALATSGNYERFVTIENTRYAHIIDPTSGYPVKGMASVTVIAPDATTADGLSTALFVAGLKAAPELLTRFPDCEALLIPDTQPLALYATPRLRSWLHLTTDAQIRPLAEGEPTP